MGNLIDNHIIPTALNYQQRLLDILYKHKAVFGETEEISIHKALLTELNNHISAIYRLKNEMIEARKKANNIEDIRKKAKEYSEKVKPYLEEIRSHVDKIEMMVDNNDWPLPKYRELLFIR